MGTLYVVLAVVAIIFIVRLVVIFKNSQKQGGTKQAVVSFIVMLVAALVAFLFLKK